ncbi:UbiX family flavin prenyltransferase [Vallitalea okinawensis]|uniref:UbiX family flavin prenyltransferase n=1 Tax=Vallitalea okinawensis TaxID=2078660 RepID=UPI000CFBC005|nr:flavin prenyltransferase UbiX [Vallitalea okinawensis]
MARYIVGITGASGSVYGKRVVEELAKEHEVFLIVTDNGRKVFEYELGVQMDQWLDEITKSGANVKVCDIDNMFAPVASGSFQIDGMVILPCSMGSLAKICHGTSDNLLIRAADVMIKEKRRLILVPRETPFSTIHLKNMLALSELGVILLPPMPAYYHLPKSIEEMVELTVGRILNHLGVSNDLHQQWIGRSS